MNVKQWGWTAGIADSGERIEAPLTQWTPLFTECQSKQDSDVGFLKNWWTDFKIEKAVCDQHIWIL